MSDAHEPHSLDTIATNLNSHEGRVLRDLDRSGLACVGQVIPPDWLAAARAEVDGYIARHGMGEHSLTDCDRWECPSIIELAADKRIESFLRSLAFPTGAPADGTAYRQRVLRILDGSAIDSPPFDWHYDASAVTMVVPVVIPDDGTGHLAIFQNHRPHRRWATVSAAERLLIHNTWYQRRLRRRYDRDPAAATVGLTPGDVYIFRGYRSLHATLPWPPNTLRVTLLLQYGLPYGPEGAVAQAIRTRRNAARKLRTQQTMKPTDQ